MNIKEINDIIDKSSLKSLDKIPFVKTDELAYSHPKDDAIEFGGNPKDYAGVYVENSLHDYYIAVHNKGFDYIIMEVGIFYRYYYPAKKTYLYGVDFYGNIYSAACRGETWDIVRFTEWK